MSKSYNFDGDIKHIIDTYSIKLDKDRVKIDVDRFLLKIAPIIKTFGVGYNRWVHIVFSKTKKEDFYIFQNGFNIASNKALNKKIDDIIYKIIKRKNNYSIYFWIRFSDTKKLGYWVDDFTIRIRPFNPKYEIGDKIIQWSDCKWDSNFIIPTKEEK